MFSFKLCLRQHGKNNYFMIQQFTELTKKIDDHHVYRNKPVGKVGNENSCSLHFRPQIYIP